MAIRTRKAVEESLVPGDARHRPEQMPLYQLVEQHYPRFLWALTEQDQPLPELVRQEFEGYLQCERLEYA